MSQPKTNPEEIHGIVPEPKGLCTTIDKCQQAIYLNDKDTAAQLLEELKGQAIDLRTWGEQWKKLTIKQNH